MASGKQGKLNRSLDQSDMHVAIKSFPKQIEESFAILKKWHPIKNYSSYNKIIILGMGGSAIGGDLVKVVVQNDCFLPIIINRSYSVPEFVDSNSLVLCSSYSGDTEETISAFNRCIEKESTIIIFSSGGKLTEYAQRLGLDYVLLPSGYQPRAALGYSFTFILIILEKIGLISNDILNQVKQTLPQLTELSLELSKESNSALTVAKQIHNKCPIIYGSEETTWVAAVRLRGQLAENAKMLSFHHNFPEQNHNEIEGWTKNNNILKMFSIIWLKDQDDFDGTKLRMEISSFLLKSNIENQITIYQDGSNRIERLIKMIHYVDWISFYSALLNDIDPTPVNRIQELKNMMAQRQ